MPSIRRARGVALPAAFRALRALRTRRSTQACATALGKIGTEQHLSLPCAAARLVIREDDLAAQ